ncbi:hypothetical protein [uncultured Pseudacidovorax sp.]|uniref:hypothetical protein n=1 Tax=uncultured Pseudacidovorax sp. TaxID=679313 RepID=UPI0025FD1279|nr:hypothetical protein [uncultured Pseudacidovorax sp.]
MSIPDAAHPAEYPTDAQPDSPTRATVGTGTVHSQVAWKSGAEKVGEEIVDAARTARRLLDALVDLLERAEARISANFRVPPGGG